MGKKIYTISIVIIFILSISVQRKSVAGIEAEDYFVYEVTNAGYYIEIGENKKSVDGYSFGPSVYNPNVEINATIFYISSNGINFRMWLGNQSSHVFLSIDWFDFKAKRFCYYTLYHTYEMIDDFINGYVVDITLFHIYPYIFPIFSEYLANPETLGEHLCTQFDDRLSVHQDIQCTYKYDESSDGIVFFESWFGGKIDNIYGRIINGKQSLETDITFGNNFHFKADKTTGIIYGLGYQGWVKGTINDTNVKVSTICEYHLKNHEMPKYQFGSFKNFNKSNLAAIIIPSISVPLIVIAIPKIRKHRQRSQQIQS